MCAAELDLDLLAKKGDELVFVPVSVELPDGVYTRENFPLLPLEITSIDTTPEITHVVFKRHSGPVTIARSGERVAYSDGSDITVVGAGDEIKADLGGSIYLRNMHIRKVTVTNNPSKPERRR